MMKLRHLFNNTDLTQMLLENWVYDPDSLNLFQYFRISANAVYPFRANNRLCFLRFAPVEEKSRESVLAELEFLRYLRGCGYPAADTVLSKEGRELEIASTPWGEYLAVVFQGVDGKRLDKVELNEEVIFNYGKALGRMHRLAVDYQPRDFRRPDFNDHLRRMEEILQDFPGETGAMAEIQILRDFFAKLPQTKENFGLIHYDFEPDNVFFDEVTGSFPVIDFDDAQYHWFIADIEQSLDSLLEEGMVADPVRAKTGFIDGYRSEFGVSDEMVELMPAFRRYANLYGYVRFLRCTAETWKNEPEWMVGLRQKLAGVISERAKLFGMKL